jgi:thiosulfate/3-mercaptopyruvate sulfurtransferase
MRLALLAVAGIALADPASAQPAARAASTPLLVDAAWLHQRLTGSDVVVLEALGRSADERRDRIPGSRAIASRDFAVDGPDGLGAELPPIDALRTMLEERGVSTNAHVVVYGEILAAARLFYTLDVLGVQRVSLLNGGMAAWAQAGYAVSRESVRPARGSLALSPRMERRVDGAWVRARLEDAAVVLIDARPDDEFTGSDGGMNGMHAAGHLPGARQLVWLRLVTASDQQTLVPAAELERLFKEAGAAPGRTVVSYCMVGLRASLNYFAARLLGYDARMYDGSIVDWTARRGPTETGRP